MKYFLFFNNYLCFSESGGHIAFISEECMSRDRIYEYNPSRGELELGEFSVFTGSNVAGDRMWNTKYSQITSLVVLSKLLLGSPNEIKHPIDHPLSSEFLLRTVLFWYLRSSFNCKN